MGLTLNKIITDYCNTSSNKCFICNNNSSLGSNNNSEPCKHNQRLVLPLLEIRTDKQLLYKQGQLPTGARLVSSNNSCQSMLNNGDSSTSLLNSSNNNNNNCYSRNILLKWRLRWR